jgi:hypothetical protein
MKNTQKQSIKIPAITAAPQISTIATEPLFNSSEAERKLSPIDQYTNNNKVLNIIGLGAEDTTNKELYLLVFLGYMSAVESYLRALFRGIISIDSYSQRIVAHMEITYAAAVYHEGHILPDALFEGTSLASPKNVRETIKKYIGITKNLPSDVETVLSEFDKICELRHCCIHRFGKLGAKNAVKLGIYKHKEFLENPMALKKHDLENISHFLRAFVNTLNRYLFESLLDRMAKNKGSKGEALYDQNWHWHYNKDKKRFNIYYNLFASTLDSQSSPLAKVIYDSYRKKYR